jgi:hypothetical protein
MYLRCPYAFCYAGNFEKEAELVLRRSLEYIILAALHPNTGISIILQVISSF